MITKQLGLLLAVLLTGLSSVYFLPRQLGYQPMGIKLALPAETGPWHGQPGEITEREHIILGADVQFDRMMYSSSQKGRVLVSIVLAGQDMMTGLHRPESCLLAQGWNPGGSAKVELTVPGFGQVPATRLLNSRKVQREPNSPMLTLNNVCYYFFVGATRVVGSHERRVWTDSLDRLVHGYNQRWGMVLTSADVTAGLDPRGRTEADADEAVRDVIGRIVPTIVSDGVH